MSYPVYIVEDSRAVDPEIADRAIELEVFGSWYTYRNLMTWQGYFAHLVKYQDNRREYIGAVDDILTGRIRPPLEVLNGKTSKS